VRLGLAREGRPLLDKTVHVFGDAKQPFAKMPLTYERALGGPGAPNPVGREPPNVVDPKDPRRFAGFAPISRLWPVRKQLVQGLDRRVLDDARGLENAGETPDGLSGDYFQTAPFDQQVEYLRGGEWLVIDGVHPTLPRVSTRLPTSAPRVHLRAGGA